MIQTKGVTPSIYFTPNAGNLIYPNFNKICEWFSGTDKVCSENGYSELAIKTKGLILNSAKSLWFLHSPLQFLGLFNESFNKLAKAWYGTIWPAVYTGYRPLAPNRRTLEGNSAPDIVKTLFNVNEHLRVWAGSLVSIFYGGGGLGMVAGWLTKNDDFFDKSFKFYQEWMLNQNFIFGLMNLNNLWLRKYNKSQVQKAHHPDNTLRAYAELFDGFTLIPNAITRSLATCRLFGVELSDGLCKTIDTLGFTNYATWAYRYGSLKGEKEEGGDLLSVSEDLKGTSKKIDETLYNTQKFGSRVFRFLCAPLSLGAAFFRAIGNDELSKTFWKLEGIVEKLQTATGSWGIRETWMKQTVKEKARTEDDNLLDECKAPKEARKPCYV
ncbi:MAG: hypothetical protein HYY52_05990 [Candidatus Melainabacteria bacterium]|nr:hypothetical protein [Candidatus Melainabacteria bacterium]